VSANRADLLDCCLKNRFVRLRRLLYPADFAHKLQRGGVNFILIGRWLKIVERPDIAAHAIPPL
jgi:hypothetical protein